MASIDTSANRGGDIRQYFLKASRNVTSRDENKILRHTSERHKHQREGEDPAMVRYHFLEQAIDDITYQQK